VPELDTGDPTAPYLPTFDTGSFDHLMPAPEPADAPPSEPLPVSVAPEAFPSTYHNLKRWMFVLMVTVVWTVAAVVGLALYEWWFRSPDKTGPVFVVLIDLVVCTVAGLLAAMVQKKPLVSALAIALMSAPLASTAAAAALYGAYVFQWIDR
jgi:RsiW-degrading membrane proteinase PrsW (M82 family)